MFSYRNTKIKVPLLSYGSALGFTCAVKELALTVGDLVLVMQLTGILNFTFDVGN